MKNKEKFDFKGDQGIRVFLHIFKKNVKAELLAKIYDRWKNAEFQEKTNES